MGAGLLLLGREACTLGLLGSPQQATRCSSQAFTRKLCSCHVLHAVPAVQEPEARPDFAAIVAELK